MLQDLAVEVVFYFAILDLPFRGIKFPDRIS